MKLAGIFLLGLLACAALVPAAEVRLSPLNLLLPLT